jgi:hypothetical protein
MAPRCECDRIAIVADRDSAAESTRSPIRIFPGSARGRRTFATNGTLGEVAFDPKDGSQTWGISGNTSAPLNREQATSHRRAVLLGWEPPQTAHERGPRVDEVPNNHKRRGERTRSVAAKSDNWRTLTQHPFASVRRV